MSDEATAQEAAAAEQEQESSKRSINRSPSYPMFDLRTALKYTRDLYDKEKYNWTSKDVAVSHWGFSAKSSRGLRTLAALVNYGLLEETGSGDSRRVRLSELAKDILLDNREGSEARERALQRAALSPDIYQELWGEWGPDLPSDTEMEWRLTREKGFNQNAVSGFITDFRGTVEFANLRDSGILAGGNDDTGGGGDDGDSLPPVDPPTGQEKPMAPVEAKTRTWDLTIPLVSGGQAILRAPIPMTQEDYDLLTSMLDNTLKSMKKAIIRANGHSGAESGE